MAVCYINCVVESVIGTFQQIIQNSIFFQRVTYQLNYISKDLQLTHWYILTIWNGVESALKLS